MLAAFLSRCFIIYHQGGGRPSHISASNISWHAGPPRATLPLPPAGSERQRYSLDTLSPPPACEHLWLHLLFVTPGKQTPSLFTFLKGKRGKKRLLPSLIIEWMHFFFLPITDETSATTDLQFISRFLSTERSAFASFELKPSSFVLLKGKAFKLPMLIIAGLFLLKRQEMKR